MDKIIKHQLAQAYLILAFLKMDDHTYTHVSARSHDHKSFYIYPFGQRFEEVTAESLMRISLEGDILEGQEYQYNRTGYMIHGSIYQARPDIRSVFHLHTPATVAVSSLEDGLMPLSQWALHFYDKIAYHAYDSLALEGHQGLQLTKDLAHHYVMLMRHHGLLTCGRTIQEALFYAYHLEKACYTQCLTLSMGRPVHKLSPEVCHKAVGDLLTFEKNLGERDWHAWVRLMEREYC